LKCNISNAWMRWKEINDPAWIEDDLNGSIAANMSNVATMKVKLELHCNGKQEGKWSQIAFDNVKVRKYYYEEPSYYIGKESNAKSQISMQDKPASIKNMHEIENTNIDERTNVLGLIMIAMHFGSYEGDENYMKEADLNKDGVIDILDMIMVAIGETA